MDPTLQIVFNILIAVIGTLFGFILSRIFKKLDDLQATDTSINDKVTELSVKLPTDFVHKSEFSNMIDGLFKKLDRIESKLDNKVDKD